LPVLGQVIMGFQVLSGIVKMFGGDLNKWVGGMFKGIGEALNIIDTPAEKTAKAFDKVTAAASKSLSEGVFGKPAGEFAKTLKGTLTEKEIERRTGTLSKSGQEEVDEADEDKVKKLAQETIKRDIRKASINVNYQRLAKAAGMNIDSEGRVTPPKGMHGRKGMPQSGGRAFHLRENIIPGDTDSAGSAYQLPTGKATGGSSEHAREAGAPQDGPTSYAVRGFSEAQAAALSAFDAELALMAGKPAQERFLEAKESGDKDLSDEITDLITSAVTEMSPELQKKVSRVKDLLGDGDPGTNLDNKAEILKLTKEITQEVEKNRTLAQAIDKIEASVAKHRLDAIQALAKQRASMIGMNQQNLMTEKELLSTSVKRKAEIQTELSEIKFRKDTVQAHLGIINKVLGSNEAITQILKAHNVQGQIDLETSQSINGVIANITQQIIKEKGFTKEISEDLEFQLTTNLKNKDAAKEIAKLIKEQVESTDRLAALKNLEVQTERFRKTLMEDVLLGEKRRLSLIEKSLDKETELLEIARDKAKIDLTIAGLEDDKLGAGVLSEFEIEKKITDEKVKQVALDLKAQQERIRIGVRKEFFGAAQQAGLPLNRLSEIRTQLNTAETEEAFRKIASEINEEAREARVARINEAAQAKLNAISILALQQDGGNYVYESLVTGGRFAANALIEAGHTVSTMITGGTAFGTNFGPNLIPLPKVPDFSTVDTGDLSRQTLLDRDRAVGNARRQGKGFDAIDAETTLKNMVLQLETAGLVADASNQRLMTVLKQAGGVLNTFAMQVQAFVKNLAQEAEDLKFAGFRAVSAPDVLANARGKDRVARLAALTAKGLSPEEYAQQGIAKEDERAAIQDLEDQAFLSPTAAGARSFTRQIPVMTKIFDLKAKINKQGFASIEQQEKLLELEKERLGVNDSLSKKLENAFVFTQEEIQNNLTTKLVDGAKQFAKTMSDGLVDSIAKGESLGDTLRSAATDFFTTMAKAHMEAAFNQLTSGLFGGLLGDKKGGDDIKWFHRGGAVTGGSGGRDDIPTLLEDGEFVVRRDAVKKYGARFLEDLNRGNIGQMQRGGLFTPGTYGQGAIKGKGNLLDFATQSFTGGQFDQISEGDGFGSASLEPQSAALTMFGRRNSPLFQREQQSKQEAFGLYTRQIQYEEQIKEQNKEDKKAFWGSVMSAVASVGINQFMKGFGESMKGTKGGKKGPLSRIFSATGAGITGFEFEGERHGGILNFGGGGGKLPSITRAERTRSMQLIDAGRPITRALPVGESSGGAGTGLPSWGDRGGNRNIADFLQSIIDGFTDIFGGPGVLPPRGALAGIHKWGRGGSNNFVPGYATGGSVDGIPARLSDGEFVMNAAATQRMGRGNLAALNSGGGGEGGDDAIVAAINNLGDELGGRGETVINITVNSDGTQTQDTNGGGEEDQNLAARLGDSVRQIIAEEQRLGGSLRRV